MAKILKYSFELSLQDLFQLSELRAEWFCYSRSTSSAYLNHLLCVYFFNSDDREVAFLTLISDKLQTYDTGPRNWDITPVQIKAGKHPHYRFRYFNPALCRRDLMEVEGKQIYIPTAP